VHLKCEYYKIVSQKSSIVLIIYLFVTTILIYEYTNLSVRE